MSYILVILVLIIFVYIIDLFSHENFMPMQTFEQRFPGLVDQRYSYDDRPRVSTNIIYPYAKLSELPINYDPSMI